MVQNSFKLIFCISNHQHNNLVELIELLGLGMGFHVRHHSKASEMAIHIANDMHQRLTSHLSESDMPISLIMDGSTGN